MGVVPVAWQFVRDEHQQAVSGVCNRADEFCSKAKVAAEKAVSDDSSAKQRERDLEQNLRADGLYDESSVAWTASGEFAKLAQNAGRSENPDAAKVTKRRVQHIEARAVAAAVEAVSADVVEAADAAQAALQLLDEMQCLAVEAKTVAKQGWMLTAEESQLKMEDSLEKLEEQRDKAESATKKGHSLCPGCLSHLTACLRGASTGHQRAREQGGRVRRKGRRDSQ